MRSPYDAVVFAGGGCRCVWQVGFWQVVAPAIGLEPRVVGSVSAGAAMACMIFAGTVEPTLEYFKRRTAANQRNAYPLNLLSRQPVFPHLDIYRDTVLANLDAAGMARLHAGPDIRVLVARAPGRLGPRSAVLLGLLAYHAEKLGPPKEHAELGRRFGFVPDVVSVRSCETPYDVAHLILQTSCTPPLTPIYRRHDRPILDGGLIDSAPVELVPDGMRTLVLLTKPYPPASIPAVAGRDYVQPSQPIPIHKWDYTRPDLVQATYDLGRRDGERFLHRGAAVQRTDLRWPAAGRPVDDSPIESL